MYRWHEEGSEIELLIEDDSPQAVLTEALVALGDALSETRGGEAVTHEVRIDAPDLPALLAGWIEELVSLAESDGFIPERVVSIELDGARLAAVIGGERAVPQRSIKRASYDRAQMKRVEGVWWARIVLSAQETIEDEP